MQIGARRGNQRSARKFEPRSANERHECFFMNASVSVKTAETAEMDEERARRLRVGRRLLRSSKQKCWPRQASDSALVRAGGGAEMVSRRQCEDRA